MRRSVARSFADIFKGEALKNALLPLALDEDAHTALLEALARHPQTLVTVDLSMSVMFVADGPAWSFDVPSVNHRCLLDGVDELRFLLGAAGEVDAFERAHPSRLSTTA